MAILGSKRRKVSDEIPSAALADIAFLLLIFFLVTTVFPKDNGLSIVLPEPGEEQEVSQSNILHILIQESGVIIIKRGESQAEQVVSPDAIEGIWRQDVAENDGLIAAVKTHPNAAYHHMIAVLDGLKVAGAERISLQLLDP